MKADLILKGGRILTMNPTLPRAEAIAIKDERILKVGNEAQILRYADEGTRIIDLRGKTVLPGFIDTHVHLADFGRILSWIDLSDVSSISEIKARVKAKAERAPRGRWILGRGWHERELAEERMPCAGDLDEVAPENPVILYRREGRVCVVNTLAMQLAGISGDTLPPPGGVIEKDQATGKPSGVLFGGATDIVWRVIPEQSPGEVLENINSAFKRILENGITGIHWIVSSPSEKPIIEEIIKRKDLPVRVRLIVPVGMLGDMVGLGLSEGKVKVGGVMVFADGSLAAGTAALSSPYLDHPENMGRLLYSQEELRDIMGRIHNLGYQAVIQAMGDRGVEEALKAIRETLASTPGRDHRHRIENAALLRPDLIECMRKLNVTVSLQPYLIFSEFSVWSAMKRLGVERARWLYPLRSLIHSGIMVAGGSDCPMEPLNPLVQMKAAVARQFFPEESITAEEALRMFTVNAAYISFEEDAKGSIEEGKLADLTVLSGDPLETPPERLDSLRVEMTIVGGKVAFKRRMAENSVG